MVRHGNFPYRVQTHDRFRKWLCLGMPVGRWTADLAEHLVESDGEDLLLILDSLDEFLKEVPLEKTLLFLLLARLALTQCTILLTSRPGAYSDISSAHTLQIDRFYHVLGFSPDNRDLYFQKQLENEDEGKLRQWQRLIYLHEEIDQLSLVPVNACLFASLVRESDEVSAQTLTQLYTQLNVYLIRRQLHRMGLKEMGSKSPDLYHLHPMVRKCLGDIGEIAYQGVAFRKLTSSAKVKLIVDREERTCQCLGLVMEHLQKDRMGVITKVWSFAHLTLQEFVGSFWLSESSWGDQCASVRYIVHSNDNFNMFRMVVRFLCGLLADGSFRVLFVLYKYHPGTPVPMVDKLMCEQFDYPVNLTLIYSRDSTSSSFFPSPMKYVTGWLEFTEKYMNLSALLFESNSDSIYNSFPCFEKLLPQSLCFYLPYKPTNPNEWECFVRSLPLLPSIHLIHFRTQYVTLPQFRALLGQLTSCTLSYLAVKVEYKDYSFLSSFSYVIIESQLSLDTEISLYLSYLSFTNIELADPIQSASIYKPFSSFCLFNNNLAPQYNPSKLTGLHLRHIPTESVELLRTVLPRLSNLQEISLRAETNPYSLLPHISQLTNLKCLNSSLVRNQLIQVIKTTLYNC